MKNLRLIAGFTAVLATCVLWTVALADQSSAVPVQSPVPRNGDASHSEGLATGPASVATDIVARGRYLVMRSGLCIDCHSPRTEKGEFIESQHLTGAPIPFQPTVPMPWVPAAPRLAGLPTGFTEADLVHFLMTGERPHGRPPALPPMPPYRFNREDAQAIAAFLRTLPAQ